MALFPDPGMLSPTFYPQKSGESWYFPPPSPFKHSSPRNVGVLLSIATRGPSASEEVHVVEENIKTPFYPFSFLTDLSSCELVLEHTLRFCVLQRGCQPRAGVWIHLTA